MHDDEGQYWAQMQAEAEAAEAEASMAAEAEYANAMEEELKAKQAPPQPPIDKHSFEMGKAETIDRIYRAIEEGLVLMSQSYDEGKITPSEWDFLVMFSDSLKARFREILKIRKYTSTATTPQE